MSRVLYDLAGADPACRFSPFCWRIRMALAHKSLAYQTVPWHFNEKALLPQPNSGLVPVLVDGGTVVPDSWRIAEYLDATYPEHSLLGNAAARGATLVFRHWTEKALHPFVSRMVVVDLMAAVRPEDQAYFRASREQRFGMPLEQWGANREGARTQFLAALEPARAVLAEQEYIAGSAPAFADYILFGLLQWPRSVSRFELVPHGDPVCSWFERMLDLYDGLGRNAARAG